MSTPGLSSTPRTTLTRQPARGEFDRARLHELLADSLLAHVGVALDDHPLVVPMTFAADAAGPDSGGTLYLHGSVAAGWLGRIAGATVCVTVAELDGLVLARSAFHHSMNYRSAVIIGRARLVSDPAERLHALELIVDHIVPGRATTLRPSTRKELAATAVLAVPLAEASMKQRSGGPEGDEPGDISAGVWAGHIPLHRSAEAPVSAPDTSSVIPDEVIRRAQALGANQAKCEEAHSSSMKVAHTNRR